jgi:YaiO family outer membrane protein
MKKFAFTSSIIFIAGMMDAAIADEIQQQSSGYIETGAGYDALTNAYPDSHSVFVRGEIRTDPTQKFTGEINEIDQFGSTGPLIVGGYEKDFDPLWILQLGGAFSPGSNGYTLPQSRFDVAVGRKWLEQNNLVTTLGLTHIQYKDVHTDQAVQLSAAYYFEHWNTPLAIEGGAIHNISNPGSAGAMQYFGAFTEGREKDSIVSLRIGNGMEAYQLVGNTTALSQFSFNSALLTWRKWLTHDYGFQLRADSFQSPYYQQHGVEASWFKDF